MSVIRPNIIRAELIDPGSVLTGFPMIASSGQERAVHCTLASMELLRVGEASLAEVSAFLCSVFGIAKPARNLSPGVLRWKYIAPHPFWDGSRSYCIRQGGEIVAHACLAPVNFVAGSRIVRSCVVIDWAGSPKLPGAGSMIYKLLYPSVDAFLGIGGSASARKVVPRLGFETRGELEVFTRVVRPMRDFARRPKFNWRSGAHLARNTARLLRPPTPVPRGWSARRVDSFDETIVPVPPRSSDTVMCQHTPDLLNYLLACPAATMEGYVLLAGGSPAGYCLLSRFESQCHIADLRSENLSGAYALALQLAADSPGVSKVVATAATSRVGEAIVAAGFHRCEAMPILLRDAQRLLDGAGPLGITSVENDFFYL